MDDIETYRTIALYVGGAGAVLTGIHLLGKYVLKRWVHTVTEYPAGEDRLTFTMTKENRAALQGVEQRLQAEFDQLSPYEMATTQKAENLSIALDALKGIDYMNKRRVERLQVQQVMDICRRYDIPLDDD